MGNKVIKPKLKTQIAIDATKYVNTETGEMLDSESGQKAASITVTKEGNYVVLTSDDYIVLDSKTVKYLDSVLSKSEMASLFMMATDLKTPLNIVYNGPIPHTNESLQTFLGYSSRAMFTNILKSLMKHGVLYQIKGKIMGEVRVIYMLNPFIARKRKTIDKEVFSVFKPFL